MTEPIELAPGLWTFSITLPGSPLKSLNCYAVKAHDGGRDLLVDTGFFIPGCTQTLMQGISALGLRPENTDVFLTHMHADHVGNAAYLESLGFGIIMGALDYDLLSEGSEKRWEETSLLLCGEGMPIEVINAVRSQDTGISHTSGKFNARKVYNGSILTYGGCNFECILTPGHSPGHMCLYDRSNKVVLLGDHVLFDITPNICVWSCMRDSLGMYMSSLKKVRNIEADIALPAHRKTRAIELSARVDELLSHHEQRLNEALGIIAAEPGINAYELAARMKWSIKADSWDDFPPTQKFFAHSETVAHLDRLVIEDKLLRKRDDRGINRYWAKD